MSGSGLVQAVENAVFFNVAEFRQGVDLNGDGDPIDLLLYSISASGAEICPQVGQDGFDFQFDGEHASYLVDEARVAQDLNGDGDQLDRVVQILID